MVGTCRVIGQVFASGNAFFGMASENLTANNELSIGSEGLPDRESFHHCYHLKKNYMLSVLIVKKINLLRDVTNQYGCGKHGGGCGNHCSHPYYDVAT